MKRKILAVLLVIAVFGTLAAAETAVLRNRVNADFGNVSDVYYYSGWGYLYNPANEMQIENLEGDTGMLNIRHVYIVATDLGPRNTVVGILYDAPTDIAFTAGYYKDGEILSEPTVLNSVYKLDSDGEWDWYSNSEYAMAVLAMADAGPKYPILLSGESKYTRLTLPVCEPGRYKCCLYFREAVSNENYHYTTGSERYSISFEYEIPEASVNRFDLASLTVVEGDDSYGLRVDPTIRANRGKPPYLDRAEGKLEMRTEDGWEDISDLLRLCPENDKRRFAGNDVDGFLSQDRMYTEPLDPDGEYRITLCYRENEDGTGGRYELTLRLKPVERPAE